MGSTAAFLSMHIYKPMCTMLEGKKRFAERKRERLQSRACLCMFVLSQQPLLNVSLAQNHQFNLATILFSGVHDSSLYLSWQSEQLNFPEW